MATSDELLQKLEERFILGEISEETYKDLKAKLLARASGSGGPPPTTASIGESAVVKEFHEEQHTDTRTPPAAEPPPPPRPAPATSPRPGEILTNSIGMKLAHIPPGQFMMGSPGSEPDRYDHETLHRVTLTRGLYMSLCLRRA